jgi:hypothetical protein
VSSRLRILFDGRSDASFNFANRLGELIDGRPDRICSEEAYRALLR